ncbi:hypothetical protein AVEN_262-1 [Araneus ventricosus]|uniref:Uncharacterized protein n=1 Tax=Araneus ventricosus TaxID=182803 RepID=A0A4Y2CN43_ARAVE|nr:hypothetical protein AVEN_262-1 [Araneus ventricosus]
MELAFLSRKRYKMWEKVKYKIVERLPAITKRHLANINTKNRTLKKLSFSLNFRNWYVSKQVEKRKTTTYHKIPLFFVLKLLSVIHNKDLDSSFNFILQAFRHINWSASTITLIRHRKSCNAGGKVHTPAV